MKAFLFVLFLALVPAVHAAATAQIATGIDFGDLENLPERCEVGQYVKGIAADHTFICEGIPAGANTTPGGSFGAIQYNHDGNFGGFGAWDGSSLTISGTIYANINASYVNNSPWSNPGTCAAGYAVQNTTTSGVQCILMTAALPTLSNGSVVFSNGATITQDNANLFYNDTNNFLGVGTNYPTATLTAKGALSLVVNGTTTPNVAGTYLYNGTYNGYNYYQNGTYYIWYRIPQNQWWISPGLGVFTNAWYATSTLSSPPTGGWTAFGGSSGTLNISGYLVNLITNSGANSLLVSPTGDYIFGKNYLNIHGTNGLVSSGSALYVNTTSSRVGIGTSTMTTPLSIAVDAGGNGFNIDYGATSFFFQAGGINGAALLSKNNNSTKGFVLGTDLGAASGPAGQFMRFTTSAQERMIIDDIGFIGIGTIPDTKLHVIATTEQLRLGYNKTRYLSTTIDSSGSATMSLNGTNPQFKFSNNINVTNTINAVNVSATNALLSGIINVTQTITSVNASAWSGYVICYTTGGTLGHCTSVVGITGQCTCASN